MPEHSFGVSIPVVKVDAEQRLVTGWASLATDGGGKPVIDSQGDIIPIDELEKAAHEAFKAGGAGRAGDMHETPNTADIVESFVATPEKMKALGYDSDGKSGWIVTLKVNDDEQWALVKSGQRLELSIRGTAERVAA